MQIVARIVAVDNPACGMSLPYGLCAEIALRSHQQRTFS